jgi:phenylacetate-CoA ligase
MVSTIEPRISELISFARQKSPYYRQLYINTSQDVSSLSKIPLVDHPAFWSASSSSPSHNKVLTLDFIDGLIFRTEATTAVPKTSYITRDEFHSDIESMSRCLVQAGLQPGDRVANPLYGGDLYKGFLDLSLALKNIPLANVHLSIGGVASHESQSWILQ